MNPRSLLQLIPLIKEGRHRVEELSIRSGLSGSLTQEALQLLFENGIGRLESGDVVFKEGDGVAAAALAVKMGCSVEEASRELDWRAFEDFVSKIFAENGYSVKRGFRLKRPRAEIDIVAYSGGRCLAVDCKHWGRTVGASSMGRVARRQIERSRYLLEADVAVELGLRRIYPVIATLFEEVVKIVEGVPVIPVTKLAGFLLEFEGYSDLLIHISR